MFTLTPCHCCSNLYGSAYMQQNSQNKIWNAERCMRTHLQRACLPRARSCFPISFICGSLVGDLRSSVSPFSYYLHSCLLLLFSSKQTRGTRPHLPPCCCWYLHCCFLILLSCCAGLESSLRVMTHWTVTQTKRSVCFSSLDCWLLTSSQTLG